MTTPMTVEELAKAQAVEYGTYVATQSINHDGVLAYNPGDPVPVSNVEQYGYAKDGLVAKVNTKAAAAAVSPTEKG